MLTGPGACRRTRPSPEGEGPPWYAWAFEVRGVGSSVWVGAWEQPLCEGLRRVALEGHYREAGIESFSPCYPVTITDEPTGVQAWIGPLDSDNQIFAVGDWTDAERGPMLLLRCC